MILVVGVPSVDATCAREGDFGFAFHGGEVMVVELVVVLKGRVRSNFVITNGG